MNKRMILLPLALSLCLFLGLPVSVQAAEEVIATPSNQIQKIEVNTAFQGYFTLTDEVPVYSIIQDNGYGANYVRLRDIAYYIDFDVLWDPEKPNEVRIYTDRHYLGLWTDAEAGPATESKTATKSTMDIYVDDVKVDIEAYMIDNNNYFKVRDIAKAVNFGCVYYPKNYYVKESYVLLESKRPYKEGVECTLSLSRAKDGYWSSIVYSAPSYTWTDDPNEAWTQTSYYGVMNKDGYWEKEPFANPRLCYADDEVREIEYQPAWSYGPSSGALMETPNINEALNPRTPTARKNYAAEYLSPDVQKRLGGDPNSWTYAAINVMAQTLADADKITANDTETYPVIKKQRGGIKTNYVNVNPYYRYPCLWLDFSLSAYWYVEDMSLGYHFAEKSIEDMELDHSSRFRILVPATKDNPPASDVLTDNPHETLQGIRQDTAHILAKLEDFDTDREKITYLGQQVCERMTYTRPEIKPLVDSGDLKGGIAALNDGSFWAGWPSTNVACGICEEYTRAFQRICAAAGYDYIRLINATHTWDAVFLPDENKWVIVDCTWADAPDYNNTPSQTQEYYNKYLCCELDDYDGDTLQNETFNNLTFYKTIIELANLIRLNENPPTIPKVSQTLEGEKVNGTAQEYPNQKETGLTPTGQRQETGNRESDTPSSQGQNVYNTPTDYFYYDDGTDFFTLEVIDGNTLHWFGESHMRSPFVDRGPVRLGLYSYNRTLAEKETIGEVLPEEGGAFDLYLTFSESDIAELKRDYPSNPHVASLALYFDASFAPDGHCNGGVSFSEEECKSISLVPDGNGDKIKIVLNTTTEPISYWP